jgi:hypothetical protein
VGSSNAAAARSRQMPTVPPVQPLNPSFFRGDTARSAATRNQFLHGVLITSRLRLWQKLKILSETMLLLASEFNDAAEDVCFGITIAPMSAWATLESLHDDFTTCLRESEVVLKCFLRALPAEQVEAFRVELDSTAPLELAKPKPRVRAKASRASA